MRFVFAALLLLWSNAVMAAEPIKVMILDGASAAAYHDWKLGTQIMNRASVNVGDVLGDPEKRRAVAVLLGQAYYAAYHTMPVESTIPLSTSDSSSFGLREASPKR